MRGLKVVGLLAVALAGLVLAPAAVFAQTITSINVDGVERVERETAQSYLPYKVGDTFDAAETTAIIKSLYASGLFANAELTFTDGKLHLKVVENPMVNKVAFEGNSDIATKRLEEIISIKTRSIYSPAKVQADVQTLQAAYRSRGRFTTGVKAQLIQRDQNRVDVIYVIEESAKSRIASINFVGNQAYTDGDLSEIVATKRSAWWRVLSTADTYEPARLDVDKESLRRYYLSKGYADVQVTSAVAELTRDKNDFIITYTIYEGPRYDFGKVDLALKAEAEGLNLAEFQPLVTEKDGELFNADRVNTTTDKLIDALGNKGFAFLDVKPQYNKREADRKVDVTFGITPGPRVYVGRINIIGNDRTRDNVIRREMRLVEGDAYSADKIKRSKDRLTYLGYFENVDVKQAETSSPDKVDLDVSVKEQSTGEFNVGAGYSTYDGLLATADVRERNFLGKGQEVNVRFAVSQRQQNFNLGFTEPYFLGQELAAGGDVFNEQTDLQDESSYDLDNMGGALRLRFPVDEFTSNALRLGFKSTKISNVGSGASKYVKDEAGRRDAISFSNTYAIDTRDSQLTPTRGYRVAATGEYAGFGLDSSFVKGTLSGTYNYPLADEWVVTFGGRAGAVSGIGDKLAIYEHFSGGGNTLRGFEFGGIGPRDRTTGDSLGGQYMLGNSVELTFPLGSAMKEMGVHGLLFSDGGIVTGFDSDDQNSLVDSKTYRMSAGGGIFWRSPIGPLRLELGVPVVKADEDKDQIFSFSVGSRF